MREMSKWNSLSDTENGVVPAGVRIKEQIFPAGPGHFGRELAGDDRHAGLLAYVDPLDACSTINNKNEVQGKFAIAKRGQCTFAQKVRNMQSAGVKLAIVLDNVQDSTHENTALFAMSGDGKDDIEIPAVFLFSKEGHFLTEAMKTDPHLTVTVGELKSLKRQYENNCDNGNCETVLEAPGMPADKESFDHLKKVLSQLVAQFELSLSSEEAVLQKTCSEENLSNENVHISKDKFTNEMNHKVERTACSVKTEPKGPTEPSKDDTKNIDSDRNKLDEF